MTSPASPSFGRRIVQEWDLTVSLAISVVFLICCLISRKPLINLTTVLGVGLGVGATIGTAIFVVMRNVDDLLRKEDYGDLVRLIDGDQRRALRPFMIVSLVAYATSAASLFALLFYNVAPTLLQYIVATVLLGLSSYTLLGAITLIGIYQRHSRRMATLRDIQRTNEFHSREAKRKQKDDE